MVVLEQDKTIFSFLRSKSRIISSFVLMTFLSLNLTPVFATTAQGYKNSNLKRANNIGRDRLINKKSNRDNRGLQLEKDSLLAKIGNFNSSLESLDNSSRDSLSNSSNNLSSNSSNNSSSPTVDWSSPFNNKTKYSPYFEFGGAKYFNQHSKVAGIYNLFIPLLQTDDKLFFTDLRIFDRSGSSSEGNFHLGYRRLLPNNRMIGIYGGFDLKKSYRGNRYNQIMVGLEYWQNQWFIGANIYKPLGTRKNLFKEETSSIKPLISRGIVDTKHYETAIPGGDVEIGYALRDSFTLYGGGYYFHSDDTGTIAGPKTRIVYNYNKPIGRLLGVLDGISVEAGVQYDKERQATAYIGIKLKVGLTSLEKNSNILGFERHMTELVRRDPDVVIKEDKQQREFYQDSKYGFKGKFSDGSFAWFEESLEELLNNFGLPANATLKDVKKKWREYVMLYHPDNNRNLVKDEQMKRIESFVWYSNLREKILNKMQPKEFQSEPNQDYQNNFSTESERTFADSSLVAVKKMGDPGIKTEVEIDHPDVIVIPVMLGESKAVNDSVTKNYTCPIFMVSDADLNGKPQGLFNFFNRAINIIDRIWDLLLPIPGVYAASFDQAVDRTFNILDLNSEPNIPPIPPVMEPTKEGSLGINELMSILAPEPGPEPELETERKSEQSAAKKEYTSDDLIGLLQKIDSNSNGLSEYQINILERSLTDKNPELDRSVLNYIIRILTRQIVRHIEDFYHVTFLLNLARSDEIARYIIVNEFCHEIHITPRGYWRNQEVFNSFASLLSIDGELYSLAHVLIIDAHERHGYSADINVLPYFYELLSDDNLKRQAERFIVNSLKKLLQLPNLNDNFVEIEKYIKDLYSKVDKFPPDLISGIFEVYSQHPQYFAAIVFDLLAEDRTIPSQIVNILINPLEKPSLLVRIDNPVMSLFMGLRALQNHVILAEDTLRYLVNLLATEGTINRSFWGFLRNLFSRTSKQVVTTRILGIDLFYKLREKIPDSLKADLIKIFTWLFPRVGLLQQQRIGEIILAIDSDPKRRKKFITLHDGIKEKAKENSQGFDQDKADSFIEQFVYKNKLSSRDTKSIVRSFNNLTIKLGWSRSYLISLLQHISQINIAEYTLELITVLDKLASYKIGFDEIVDRDGRTISMIMMEYVLSKTTFAPGLSLAVDRLIRDNHFFVSYTLEELLKIFAKENQDNPKLLNLIASGYFEKQINRIKEYQKDWLGTKYKLIISRDAVTVYEKNKLYLYLEDGNYCLATTVGKVCSNDCDPVFLLRLDKLFANSDSDYAKDTNRNNTNSTDGLDKPDDTDGIDNEIIYVEAVRLGIVPKLYGITKQLSNWISTDDNSDFIRWRDGITNIDFEDDELMAEILAVISEVAHRTILHGRYYPNYPQLLSELTLLLPSKNSSKSQGMALEVDTGEGKTLTAAMFVALMALSMRQPDVLTSSRVLARRDADDNSDFYAMLGISSGHNIVDKGSRDLNRCYRDNTVIYGDILNFNGGALQDIDSNVRYGRGFDLVVTDENDYLWVYLNNMKIQLSSETPGIAILNHVLSYMWSVAKLISNYLLPHEDPERCYMLVNDEKLQKILLSQKDHLEKNFSEFVKFSKLEGEDLAYQAEDKSCFAILTKHIERFARNELFAFDEHIKSKRSFIIPSHLEKFVEDQLPNWLRSLALVFSSQFRENVKYVVDEKPEDGGSNIFSIVPVDIGNGVLLYDLQWSDGLHQFLQLKHGLAMTSENLISTFMSYVGYLNRYGNLYGMSATFGNMISREFIRRAYKVDLVTMSNAVEKDINYYPSIFVNNEESWQQEILDQIYRIGFKQGRAVLVIVDTIEEVKDIARLLIADGYPEKHVFTYGLDSKSNVRPFKVKVPMGPNDVVVATNLAGRGTDIRPKSVVLQRGGLHVLVASIAENQETDDQKIGRTARQGEPGSAGLVINLEKIREVFSGIKPGCFEILKANGDDEDCLASLYGERDKIYAKKLQQDADVKLPSLKVKDDLFISYARFVEDVSNPIGYKLFVGKPQSDQNVDQNIEDFSLYLYRDGEQIRLMVFGEGDVQDRFKEDLDITELIKTLDPFIAKHIPAVLSEGNNVDLDGLVFSLNKKDREAIYFIAASRGYIRESDAYARVEFIFSDFDLLCRRLREKLALYEMDISNENQYLNTLLTYDHDFKDLSLNNTTVDKSSDELLAKAKQRKLFFLWLGDRENYNDEFKKRQLRENFGYFLRKIIDPLQQYGFDPKIKDVDLTLIKEEIDNKFVQFKKEQTELFKQPTFIKNKGYEILKAWHYLDLYFALPPIKERKSNSDVPFHMIITPNNQRGADAYSSPALLTKAIDALGRAIELDEIYSWQAYNARAYMQLLRDGTDVHKEEQLEEANKVNINFYNDTKAAINQISSVEIPNCENILMALGASGAAIDDDHSIELLAEIELAKKSIEILTKNHDVVVDALKNRGIVRPDGGVDGDELVKDIDLAAEALKIIKKDHSVFALGNEVSKTISDSFVDDDSEDFENNSDLSNDDKTKLRQLKEKLRNIRAKQKTLIERMVTRHMAQGELLIKVKKFDLEKPEKNWFGTIFSAIMGVALIVVGSVLAPYCGGIFSNVLVQSMIVKGVGDIISSVVSFASGIPRSATEYLKSLTASAGIAVVTAGVLSFLDHVANGLSALDVLAGRPLKNPVTGAMKVVKPDFAKDVGGFVLHQFTIQSAITMVSIGAYDAIGRKMVDRDAIIRSAETAADDIVKNYAEKLRKIYTSGLEEELYAKIRSIAEQYSLRYTNLLANSAAGVALNIPSYFMTGGPASYGLGSLLQTSWDLGQGIQKNADAMPEMVRETKEAIDNLAQISLTKSGLLERKFKSTFKHDDDAIILFQALSEQGYIFGMGGAAVGAAEAAEATEATAEGTGGKPEEPEGVVVIAGDIDCNKVGSVNLEGLSLSRNKEGSQAGYQRAISELCYEVEDDLQAADIGRFRGNFVDLTTNVVLSIRKDIARTGSNGAASYIVNLIDKFIKEEREGSQRAKLQAEAEEVEEFEGVEGDERAERAERAKGTKEAKVKYKGAEETEAGRRKERQGEQGKQENREKQGKQESKEKQEKLKKQVKEILSASRKQDIEGRVDQEPERLRLEDMLNEGWDEYFKKSHSQFKPSSEDAFGDVLSGDKSYDSEQLCLGGFCLGTGRDASNWNYQSGKILLEKYSIENELLIEYGDLGERRINWLKRYDIPKVHEWNNNAKLNGSPYEIVVDPNQVSGIQLGYLVSRPLNFPGFSLLGRTVASHEGLLFPWGEAGPGIPGYSIVSYSTDSGIKFAGGEAEENVIINDPSKGQFRGPSDPKEWYRKESVSGPIGYANIAFDAIAMDRAWRAVEKKWVQADVYSFSTEKMFMYGIENAGHQCRTFIKEAAVNEYIKMGSKLYLIPTEKPNGRPGE